MNAGGAELGDAVSEKWSRNNNNNNVDVQTNKNVLADGRGERRGAYSAVVTAAANATASTRARGCAVTVGGGTYASRRRGPVQHTTDRRQMQYSS